MVAGFVGEIKLLLDAQMPLLYELYFPSTLCNEWEIRDIYVLRYCCDALLRSRRSQATSARFRFRYVMAMGLYDRRKSAEGF